MTKRGSRRDREQTAAPSVESMLWKEEGQQGTCEGGQVGTEICVLSDANGKGKQGRKGCGTKRRGMAGGDPVVPWAVFLLERTGCKLTWSS